MNTWWNTRLSLIKTWEHLMIWNQASSACWGYGSATCLPVANQWLIERVCSKIDYIALQQNWDGIILYLYSHGGYFNQLETSKPVEMGALKKKNTPSLPNMNVQTLRYQRTSANPRQTLTLVIVPWWRFPLEKAKDGLCELCFLRITATWRLWRCAPSCAWRFLWP